MKLLLDENLETEIFHRLKNYGHDVRHVSVSDGLSRGMADEEIASVSRTESRIIVTHDDDFRGSIPESTYFGVLYIEDQQLSATQISDIVHEISKYYDATALSGFQTVGRSWLR